MTERPVSGTQGGLPLHDRGRWCFPVDGATHRLRAVFLFGRVFAIGSSGNQIQHLGVPERSNL